MDYYCDVCDKTIENQSKNKHLKSLTHNEFEKCTRTKHAFQRLNFSEIDDIFNEYVTNHKRKLETNLVKCDFNLVYVEEFYPHIKSHFQNNLTNLLLKSFFLLWIESFIKRLCIISHIYIMDSTTHSHNKTQKL